LAMIGSYTEKNVLGFFAPVVILGIPIFDTFLVTFVRWRKGIPIFLGSPDHYALRLKAVGLSLKRVIWMSYGAAVILGGLGLFIMELSCLYYVVAVLGLIFMTGLVAIFLLQRVKVE